MKRWIAVLISALLLFSVSGAALAALLLLDDLPTDLACRRSGGVTGGVRYDPDILR